MTDSCAIIIVNHRTAELAVRCLASIERERERTCDLHVVIVDNASGDDSVDWIQSAIDERGWREWVTLIESPRNGGFAAGCNIGIGSRPARYYLLLNPDTIVMPGAIASLVEFMRSNPRTGIAGSRLRDPNGAVHCTARRRPSPLVELVASARTGALSRLLMGSHRSTAGSPDAVPVRCDWVSGAAMCIRRAVFDDVGLLDEGFFLYFEEVDLCERARRSAAKWQVWAVPQSEVVHIEGASTGIGDPTVSRPPYWYESRRRYFLKHHGVLGLVAADLAWSAGRLLYAVRRSVGLARRAINAPTAPATDLLWGDARSIVKGEAFRIARRGVQG